MIEHLSDYIASFLIRGNVIDEKDYAIYRYGIKHLISNFITFIVICFLASFFQQWEASIFFFVGFMPFRLVAGGYHSDTPRRCHILSLAVYAINIIIIHYINPIMTLELYIIITGFITISIFRFAPVDHKNRLLVDKEFFRAKRRSRLIVSTMAMLMIIGLVMHVSISVSITGTIMGALTASISLITGKIKREGEKEGMKKISWLTKRFGGMIACMALIVAQMSSSQFCFIFFQDEIPEELNVLKRKNK